MDSVPLGSDLAKAHAGLEQNCQYQSGAPFSPALLHMAVNKQSMYKADHRVRKPNDWYYIYKPIIAQDLI